MTRLTYTLDEIKGPLEVSSDGSIKFEEKDGTDYAAVTVQLRGGERVPFLFTIKQLVASGKLESFGGEFLVPSYQVLDFFPDGGGVLVDFPNNTITYSSNCRRYYDLRSFGFQAVTPVKFPFVKVKKL
ncbi:hypothetical protein LXL04_020981 [Taraxacum kok-saghyz]